MLGTVTSQSMFRVATINLLNFIEPPLACYESDNIYTHAQWQAKCTWLTQCIEQLEPDVIGFQEVFSPRALAELLKPLGYNWLQVVEEPRLLEDYIYQRPVNAIASRFPVTASAPIKVQPAICQGLGIESDFQFSRAPVWCRITMPSMGACDFYCVHFKSKRPAVNVQVFPNFDAPELQAMLRRLGRASSGLTRSSEAALLMHSIIAKRNLDKLPVVLMGDFNDQLSSSAMDVLHVDDDIERCLAQSAEYQELGLDEYGLRDSFKLYQLHAGDVERIPTHYWWGRGSVLDYILLSSEFDPRSRSSTMDVSDFTVFDRHMFGPESRIEKESSDHAPVMITLTPRN